VRGTQMAGKGEIKKIQRLICEVRTKKLAKETLDKNHFFRSSFHRFYLQNILQITDKVAFVYEIEKSVYFRKCLD
jgi:hypothetical protein